MNSSEYIKAPWTPKQVMALNSFQRRGEIHPFTCPKSDYSKHAPINSVDDVLIATVNGWICAFCNYTQSWAHSYMAEES